MTPAVPNRIFRKGSFSRIREKTVTINPSSPLGVVFCLRETGRSGWQCHFGVFFPSASWINFSRAASIDFSPPSKGYPF